MSKSTLARYVALKSHNIVLFIAARNIGDKKIFFNVEEKDSFDYLKMSSRLCYGLTTAQLRHWLTIMLSS